MDGLHQLYSKTNGMMSCTPPLSKWLNALVLCTKIEAPYRVFLVDIHFFALKGGKCDKGHHVLTKYLIFQKHSPTRHHLIIYTFVC